MPWIEYKMSQKKLDIKKLFQRHKPEADVSVATVHGTRCILHVTNLALFGVVMILTIASALIYYLMPITDVSELSKMIDVQEVGAELDRESPDSESVNVDSKKKDMIGNETFSVINERNVFSHKRKEWVVKAVIPKSSEMKNKRKLRDDLAKKALAKKKALAGKPKKIVLHGVVIAAGLKKALINNPLKGVSKLKTLYVEEGDELDGYKVTSIEKDRIRLDWHGEEIVIMVYSGLKDFKQGGNATKAKQGGLTKFDYKFKVVEDIKAEESFDVIDVKVKEVVHADMLDETSLYLVYKEPEYFSILSFNDSHLSEAVETQEVAEMFPDIKSSDVAFSEEKMETVKAEIPKSFDLVTEEVGNAGNAKQGGLTKLDYEFKVVEDVQAEESFDVKNKKVAHADMLDETSLNPVYKEPEYFSMPAFNDSHLSEAVEMQEVAEMFPDIISRDVPFSEEKMETVKAEIPKSFDLVTEEVGNAGNAKQGGLTKLDYEFKVVEDVQAEESFDVVDVEVKEVAHADMLDETSLNPVYKEPEYFSMPAFNDSHLSEAVEMQEVAEMFPDIKSSGVPFSEEKMKTIKADIPKSVDLLTEEGIKQKALSGKPSEILLHGIVIVTARDIKKALVNIPMSPFRKERTLYVEEGDAFDGYKVTSIEPDLLRLDWHGKEMIVKFPLL